MILVLTNGLTCHTPRRTVDSGIDKWADLSHTKKNFGSKLDDVKASHKELRSAKVTSHITKCFMYCVKSHKNEPDILRCALKNVPSHFFGEHSGCREWCKAKKLTDPSSYKYASFPRQRPLQSESLLLFLQGLFDKQADNAEKMAPCGSSNRSELLNQTFTSLAPKRLHFSDSES